MNYRKSEAKEAARAQFRGLWAAITTPFTRDLRVDEDGLRHNMRHLTRNLKIEGVFCTGVMGEFWSLTKEERKRIVEIVVEEAKRGGCKVIAHTAHHSAHETVELTRHAEEVGADFVILINQYYPPASEQTMYEWFEFVASRVNIGVWMFDAEYSGWGMSPELTARIAALENVCGIKIPRPLDHYAKVQKLVGERIVMSQPTEALWLTMMRDYGQKVFQSSPAPYLMQTAGWLPMREYTELGLQGRFDEAERISSQLQPLRELMAKWMRAPWVERKLVPIAYIKAWSEMLGMAGGPVRPGLPQIGEKEREELRADLERSGLLGRVSAAKAA
jgi:4-hydroxy-tetrahydrodipicolinate synthase